MLVLAMSAESDIPFTKKAFYQNWFTISLSLAYHSLIIQHMPEADKNVQIASVYCLCFI